MSRHVLIMLSHRRRAVRAWATALALHLLAGCGFEPPTLPDRDDASASAMSALQQRVIARRSLSFDARTASIALGVLRAAEPQETARPELPLDRGQFSLHLDAESALVLDGLDLALRDVHVGAADLPPAGMRVSAIRARFENPIVLATLWTRAGAEGTASGAGALLLDWAIGASGTNTAAARLSTQRFDNFAIRMHLELDRAGRLAVRFAGQRQGLLVDWSGLVQLSDLAIQAAAIEDPATDEG